MLVGSDSGHDEIWNKMHGMSKIYPTKVFRMGSESYSNPLFPYTGLAILNIVRMPMAVFPLARTAVAEATKALVRLKAFLLLPEMPTPMGGEGLSDVSTPAGDTGYSNGTRNAPRKDKKEAVMSPHAVTPAGESDERSSHATPAAGEYLVCIKHGYFQWEDSHVASGNRSRGSSQPPPLTMSFGSENGRDSRSGSVGGGADEEKYEGEDMYTTIAADDTRLSSDQDVYNPIQDGSRNIELGSMHATTSSSPTVTESSASPYSEYVLRDVNLTITSGELVAVVGTVGSGKSSLVAAILQQIHCASGEQYLHGKVAYVSQDHWIQNKSVRDNVLFFSNMDENRYISTMDVSQLSRDLVNLPSADHTEIGERGINLSGGQKARVNIARAVYAVDTDIYLFDDPLAAVDAHVGKAVFKEAIQQQLKNKARVVVLSSNYHLLRHFDKVVVVSTEGRVFSFTSYEELRIHYPHYCLAKHEENEKGRDDVGDVGQGMDDATGEIAEDKEENGAVRSTVDGMTSVDSVYRKRQRSIEEKQEMGKSSLINEEDRERGEVSFATFHKYYSAALKNRNGTITFGIILCLFAVAQALRVLNDLWVGLWAKDFESHYSTEPVSFYMIGFTIIVFATCSFVLSRSYYFLSTCIDASRSLHTQILSSVLSAPVNKYFDITPIGRVLNRFTKDMDSVDSLLPDFFLTALQSGFHVISVLLLCIVSTPYFIVVLIPLAFTFYLIQEHFRKTSRELKRLDGISRSPIYNHFGEFLAGLPTIRAYGKQNIFLENHHKLCDVNKKCFFAFNVTNRWLSLRLDTISTFVILAVGLIAVCMVDLGSKVDRNILGLALVYSIQLGGMLQWTVRTVIETENNLTSVERLLAFNGIESEKKQCDENVPILDSHWPSQGKIHIEGLSLRYRDGLPLVLNGVTLDIPGGYKVGVCGRTGAGIHFDIYTCSTNDFIISLLRIPSSRTHSRREKQSGARDAAVGGARGGIKGDD